MNLAVRDIRLHFGRFVGTSMGLGLLFAVVVAMQGIYAGMVDDATILARSLGADLWVVQRATRGPFAEASRLDPSLEARIAAVPGVARARAYTYQIVQREHGGRSLRLALVGVAWPDDRGETLPLVAGRSLSHGHGEIVLDASLGLPIGEIIPLAGEPYRVVGLTRNALTSGGEAVAFLSVRDAQLVGNELPDEAVQIERQRTLDRLRHTDLGRSQPALEDLPFDTRFRPPALAAPSIHAVLVNLQAPHLAPQVRRVLSLWGDVTVLSTDEQLELLLQGVVQRARMQIGLFTVILTLTAAVIVMMVIYNMMLEKTHDLAVLKLLGARTSRLTALVFQQAWLLGALAYAIAFLIGELLYPSFPRRVVLTDQIRWGAPIFIFVLSTLASGLGVWHASRVDAGRVLEG
jgi:putative ABC transport system permease protein